jgi:hypothetical protein
LGRLLGRSSETAVPLADQRELSADSFEVVYARQVGKRPKGPRVYYRVRDGFGPDWEIPNNDIRTVKHALMERVFFVKLNGKYQRAPKPWTHVAILKSVEHIEDPELRVKTARLLGKQKVLDKLSGSMDKLHRFAAEATKQHPLSEEQFIDRYKGSKRKVYQAAVDSLHRKPFNLYRDSKVKCFVKDEYSKGTPRIIQPRSPRFNVMLGRWISHIEHLVFEDLDKLFDASGEHVTVQKGRNHIERGNAIKKAWDEFVNPVCIELDAARFDQHLNVVLLMLANTITKWYCMDVKVVGLEDVWKLLHAQLNNVGRFYGREGKIKYSVEGCGMSGDMNTSLRNVIIMCLGTHAYLDDIGITKYRYGNDGDDGWLIVERSDMDRILDSVECWFLELGLTMKVEGIKYHLEDIEFCQGKPVFNEDHGYVLVPKPQKRLYADLVTTKDLSSRKIYNKWMGAVAGCGLAQTVGVPVLQNHYRWISKAATPWVPEKGDIYHRYTWNADNLPPGKRVFREPTSRERISFWSAFGITPDQQRWLELHYDGLSPPRWSTPKSGCKPITPPLHRVFAPPVQADRIRLHLCL